MSKPIQPELIAEHQGKNIYKLGRGKYTTCSETFTTLAAAKRWLDDVYRARDVEMRWEGMDENSGTSESVGDYLEERVDYWQSNPYEPDTVVDAVVRELEHVSNIARERFGEHANLTTGKVYRDGLDWIVSNDYVRSTKSEAVQVPQVAQSLTVQMLAAMYQFSPETVARHVIQTAAKAKGGK